MSETTVSTREKATTFVPFGAKDSISLSIRIVQATIAVPTKSGRTCSDRDAMKFIMLCRARGLNPWEGDAFLVGYDNTDRNSGAIVPTFSLITAHQAFLKRAEVHPEYDGMKSGLIILEDDERTVKETEGDFHLPGENVVGGWATVFFKTRKIPITRRLRMARFNKGYSVWRDDPAGMIVKCAEADALRSSFPNSLGGMYLREEFSFVNAGNAMPSSAMIDLPAGTDTGEQPNGNAEIQPGPEPAAKQPETAKAPAAAAAPAPNSNADELAKFVLSEGFTFTDFQTWGVRSGGLPGADSLGSFADVGDDIARRLLRARVGLLKGLKLYKSQPEQTNPVPG